MAATANKSTETLISLELNELNFDFVRRYCDVGKLPTFKKLLCSYQLFETVAERQHPYLEHGSSGRLSTAVKPMRSMEYSGLATLARPITIRFGRCSNVPA